MHITGESQEVQSLYMMRSPSLSLCSQELLNVLDIC
jgi:hypothetical protein